MPRTAGRRLLELADRLGRTRGGGPPARLQAAGAAARGRRRRRLMLDTLAIARTLTDAGMDRDQAAAVTTAVQQVAEHGDHVTRQDGRLGAGPPPSPPSACWCACRMLDSKLPEHGDLRREVRTLRWMVVAALGLTPAVFVVVVVVAMTRFAGLSPTPRARSSRPPPRRIRGLAAASGRPSRRSGRPQQSEGGGVRRRRIGPAGHARDR